ERLAQTLVRAARGENPELRAWLSRAAALCGWELIDPPLGEPLSPQLHVAVDSGGDRVARVAAPGVRRKDRSVLCRARVEVSPEARAAEALAAEAEEVEVFAEEVAVEITSRIDDTPPPIEDRTPAHGMPAVPETAPPPAEPVRDGLPETVLAAANEAPSALELVDPAEPEPPPEDLTELDRDVAAAARQPNESVRGDHLALTGEAEATEDVDPEWDQLAQGPEAFPSTPKPTSDGEEKDKPVSRTTGREHD